MMLEFHQLYLLCVDGKRHCKKSFWSLQAEELAQEPLAYHFFEIK